MEIRELDIIDMVMAILKVGLVLGDSDYVRYIFHGRNARVAAEDGLKESTARATEGCSDIQMCPKL